MIEVEICRGNALEPSTRGCSCISFSTAAARALAALRHHTHAHARTHTHAQTQGGSVGAENDRGRRGESVPVRQSARAREHTCRQRLCRRFAGKSHVAYPSTLPSPHAPAPSHLRSSIFARSCPHPSPIRLGRVPSLSTLPLPCSILTQRSTCFVPAGCG